MSRSLSSEDAGRRLRDRPGQLLAGQEVIVRSPCEILATLDENGALDGLPFMPEMVESCGRRYRVARRMEKICVEPHWRNRLFPENDVVVLDELRCDGSGHDGCNRGCMTLWKEAWLIPAAEVSTPPVVDDEDRALLRRRLTVRRGDAEYFCQSTELAGATVEIPRRWKFRVIPWSIWIAFREIRVGNRSIGEVAALFWRHFKLIWRRKRIGDAVIVRPGPNTKTPTETLGLQPGDRVRIKPASEIEATLDGEGRNRGLRVTVAMLENCGQEFTVRERVDRIINEDSGRMRTVTNTVTLEGLECMCAYNLGGCPRGEMLYWREIWLERVDRA